MGEFVVFPLTKSEETIGFRSDYAEAIQRAIALSLSENAPYGVYSQDDEGGWKLVGTAYEGVFTAKEEGL